MPRDAPFFGAKHARLARFQIVPIFRIANQEGEMGHARRQYIQRGINQLAENGHPGGLDKIPARAVSSWSSNLASSVADAKANARSEYQSWLKGLDNIRRIVSTATSRPPNSHFGMGAITHPVRT